MDTEGTCLHKGCQINSVKCEKKKHKKKKKKGKERGPRIGMAFFIFLKWMNDVTDGNICAHPVHGPVHFAALIVFKKRLVSKKLSGK